MLFSEPKIPQCKARGIGNVVDLDGFSALQRAENSSMNKENCFILQFEGGFSALQRAENSSIAEKLGECEDRGEVSVLFSEPKIPQFRRPSSRCCATSTVSVLFSEPKIPQSLDAGATAAHSVSFSALQRAENSSIV